MEWLILNCVETNGASPGGWFFNRLLPDPEVTRTESDPDAPKRPGQVQWVRFFMPRA